MFPNQDNGRFLVEEDGTLVIDSTRRSDAGEYSCHALSQAGSIQTSITIDVRGIHLKQKSPAVARKDALQPIQFPLQYDHLQGHPRSLAVSRYGQFSIKNAHFSTPIYSPQI